MNHQQGKFITFSVAALLFLAIAVECDRAGKKQNVDGGFKSPCGSADFLTKKIGGCMVEIFQLIEGKFGEPKTDDDLVAVCNRFNGTARCAATIAKDCLTGIHKTAVGAVASATRRLKTSECKTPATRGAYKEPLKCAIQMGKEMNLVFQNHTGIMQGIRDLDASPEEKLMKMCCVLNSLDRELETRYGRTCPSSVPYVLKIVHSMTDDARSTLCVAPKCNHALDKVINHKYKPPQNLIEPVVQILFLLNVS